MSRIDRELSSVLKRPLCRRYVLGIFDVAVVRLRDANGSRECWIHWAFGWLADGECESLGVWVKSDAQTDEEFQQAVLDDLKCRGVERIWRVAGLDSQGLQDQVATAFPCAKLTSLQGRGQLSAPSELAFMQLRAGLSRSMRRHGVFSDRADLLDFMSSALQRAEHRLDRQRQAASGRCAASQSPWLVPLSL